MICGGTWRREVIAYTGAPSDHRKSVMPHHAYRRRPRRASLAALVALSCCTAAALGTARAAESAAGDTGVLRATLANGLRVVIVRNTLAPVVATAVNYLVGSDEAPVGFPGTAHAEEHMMFRGSPGLSADQLADIGSVVGGDFNANTREGITQYLFTVPAEDLDVALHIEALRMRAVLYSPQEWRHERGAIEQEVAQDLSEPAYVLFEKLRASMFAGTHYAHDALGTRPSFEKTSARMLKSFHDTWYAPNNAILVIAGDLDPVATLSEVKLLFGDIRAKKLPPKPQVSLRPVRPTAFTLDTDRPSGTLMIALRTPGPRAADFAALEVLADVLSSRRFDLYGLVPAGKAVAAEFALDPLPQAALAYAMLSFTSGDDPKALEREVRAILARFARDGVPPQLVEAHPPALPAWAQKALQRLEVPPSTLHPIVSTLPNGLTLIVQSEDVSDTVSVYGHIRNRPETEEPKGQEGVAQVLDRLLTYGSERLDRVAFQQALDAIGAREHAGTDFSVQVLAEHFERALELLADNELHPALPDAAMEVIRGQVALGIAARARNAQP